MSHSTISFLSTTTAMDVQVRHTQTGNAVTSLPLLLQRLPAYPPLSLVEKLIFTEKRGNCVPVFVELPGDLLTPCTAYLRIAKDSKYSFLLESVVNGENLARYSFIGAGMWTLQTVGTLTEIHHT